MILKKQFIYFLLIQIRAVFSSNRMSCLQRNIRFFTRRDRKVIKFYLNSINVKKIHIGCGTNILKGWLNTDYMPVSNEVILMDATQKLPFENNTFDYVFSEHMIEHITYTQGGLMLSECFRVLKSGGKLRVSTPDLRFLFSLY